MIFTVRQVSLRRIAYTVTHFIRDGVDPRISVDMAVSRNTYRGADMSLAQPTSRIFCLMVRIFRLTLVFLCI